MSLIQSLNVSISFDSEKVLDQRMVSHKLARRQISIAAGKSRITFMRVQEGDRLFDESDGAEKPADIIATRGL